MTQLMSKPANGTTNQIVKTDYNRPPGDVVVLRKFFEAENISRELAKVLPKHLKPEWIARMTIMAAMRNPDILKCTLNSINLAVTEAGTLGLNPSGGVLGEAYLVPFNKKFKDANGRDGWRMECQMITGFRGLIVLARRSGHVVDVDADVVYRGDDFTYKQGREPVLDHTPNYEIERRDEDIVGVWVIWRMKDGNMHQKFIPRQDIEKRRRASKAGASKENGSPIGIWKSWYPEMSLKTGIRISSKLVPSSSEDLARALDDEDEIERDVDVLSAETGEPNPAPKSRAISNRVRDSRSAEPTGDERTIIPAEDPAPAVDDVEVIDAQTGEVLNPGPSDTPSAGTAAEAEHESVPAAQPPIDDQEQSQIRLAESITAAKQSKDPASSIIGLMWGAALQHDSTVTREAVDKFIRASILGIRYKGRESQIRDDVLARWYREMSEGTAKL